MHKEFKIIEDAKNILENAIGVDIDSSQPILYELSEVVVKFNEDTNGQDKLLQKAKKKFETKVLEYIS